MTTILNEWLAWLLVLQHVSPMHAYGMFCNLQWRTAITCIMKQFAFDRSMTLLSNLTFGCQIVGRIREKICGATTNFV